MEQSGGRIKGGTISLEGDTTSLTQGEQGRICGGSFTLSNGASLRNSGKISGGSFSLSESGTEMEGAGRHLRIEWGGNELHADGRQYLGGGVHHE